MNRRLRIAIDGPAASGKTSVGQRLAEVLGLPFLDSGLFYRSLAWLAVENETDLGDPAALQELAAQADIELHPDPGGGRVKINGRYLQHELRSPALSQALARVSQLSEVRQELVARQRREAEGGIVMVGRDIGTVILPDADFKFFVTASLGERARRRRAQLQDQGREVDQAQIETEIADRDRSDQERAVAPLRPAPDAEVVETDGQDLEQVVETLRSRVSSGQAR